MVNDISDLKADMSIVKPAVERNCKDSQELRTDMVELKKDMKEVKSELSYVKFAVMDMSKTSKDREKRIEKIEEKVTT